MARDRFEESWRFAADFRDSGAGICSCIRAAEGQITAAQAGAVLDGMLRKWRGKHEFLPDDQSARVWPTWCQSAARTTDAHLLALAKAHQAELATLDAGIPGGFLIPQR
jgi:hypothetical protein